MVKRATVWVLIAAGLAAAVATARTILAPKTGSVRSSGVPAIGGDTWPPVPLNPDRPA
jgi:hypothetical protein